MEFVGGHTKPNTDKNRTGQCPDKSSPTILAKAVRPTQPLVVSFPHDAGLLPLFASATDPSKRLLARAQSSDQ